MVRLAKLVGIIMWRVLFLIVALTTSLFSAVFADGRDTNIDLTGFANLFEKYKVYSPSRSIIPEDTSPQPHHHNSEGLSSQLLEQHTKLTTNNESEDSKRAYYQKYLRSRKRWVNFAIFTHPFIKAVIACSLMYGVAQTSQAVAQYAAIYVLYALMTPAMQIGSVVFHLIFGTRNMDKIEREEIRYLIIKDGIPQDLQYQCKRLLAAANYDPSLADKTAHYIGYVSSLPKELKSVSHLQHRFLTGVQNDYGDDVARGIRFWGKHVAQEHGPFLVLYGAPGEGKTKLAKELVQEIGLISLEISGTDVNNLFGDKEHPGSILNAFKEKTDSAKNDVLVINDPLSVPPELLKLTDMERRPIPFPYLDLFPLSFKERPIIITTNYSPKSLTSTADDIRMRALFDRALCLEVKASEACRRRVLGLNYEPYNGLSLRQAKIFADIDANDVMIHGES